MNQTSGRWKTNRGDGMRRGMGVEHYATTVLSMLLYLASSLSTHPFRPIILLS